MPVIEMEFIRYTNRSGAGLLFKFPTEKEIELVPIVILLVSIVSLVFINHTTVELYLSDELETAHPLNYFQPRLKSHFYCVNIGDLETNTINTCFIYRFTLDTGDACYNRRTTLITYLSLGALVQVKFYSVNTKLMNM